MKSASLIDERVTVVAMDGNTYKDIFPAKVLNEMNMIIVMRTDIPIRHGDKISHRTPAGGEEIFIVEVSSLKSGKEEIPAHYELQVRRA